MTSLAATKKAMGNALKTQLSKLTLPGEVSKKVSVKMRLQAQLDSGCEATLACAEVSGGRPTGHYGLYWLVSLREGPIHKVMVETGLDKAKNFHGDILFSATSQNISAPSHYEVGPDADFSAIAAAICGAMERDAVPIITAFNSDPGAAVDYLIEKGPGRTRNPFTACVILLHLAKRTDRIDELIAAASSRPGFYDFVDSPNPVKSIVEPVARWFQAHQA